MSLKLRTGAWAPVAAAVFGTVFIAAAAEASGVTSSTQLHDYGVSGTTMSGLVGYMMSHPFPGDEGPALANIRPTYSLAIKTQDQSGVCRPSDVSLDIRFVMTLPKAEAEYQLQIQEIVGGLSKEGAHRFCAAFLVPELTNVYDPHAVRIQIKSLTVGYLPRNVTQALSEALQRVGCLGAACRASVTGSNKETEGDSYFRVRLNGFLPFDLLRLKE